MKIYLFNLPQIEMYINNMIKTYLTYSKQLSEGDILIINKINKLRLT